MRCPCATRGSSSHPGFRPIRVFPCGPGEGSIPPHHGLFARWVFRIDYRVWDIRIQRRTSRIIPVEGRAGAGGEEPEGPPGR